MDELIKEALHGVEEVVPRHTKETSKEETTFVRLEGKKTKGVSEADNKVVRNVLKQIRILIRSLKWSGMIQWKSGSSVLGSRGGVLRLGRCDNAWVAQSPLRLGMI